MKALRVWGAIIGGVSSCGSLKELHRCVEYGLESELEELTLWWTFPAISTTLYTNHTCPIPYRWWFYYDRSSTGRSAWLTWVFFSDLNTTPALSWAIWPGPPYWKFFLKHWSGFLKLPEHLTWSWDQFRKSRIPCVKNTDYSMYSTFLIVSVGGQDRFCSADLLS